MATNTMGLDAAEMESARCLGAVTRGGNAEF